MQAAHVRYPFWRQVCARWTRMNRRSFNRIRFEHWTRGRAGSMSPGRRCPRVSEEHRASPEGSASGRPRTFRPVAGGSADMSPEERRVRPSASARMSSWTSEIRPRHVGRKIPQRRTRAAVAAVGDDVTLRDRALRVGEGAEPVVHAREIGEPDGAHLGFRPERRVPIEYRLLATGRERSRRLVPLVALRVRGKRIPEVGQGRAGFAVGQLVGTVRQKAASGAGGRYALQIERSWISPALSRLVRRNRSINAPVPGGRSATSPRSVDAGSTPATAGSPEAQRPHDQRQPGNAEDDDRARVPHPPDHHRAASPIRPVGGVAATAAGRRPAPSSENGDGVDLRLPAGIILGGATPEGGGDERVKMRTAPRPNRAPVPLGSLPSTPQAAPAPRPTAR